ncbi:hypothetical protein F5884DRAFT_856721 [Xylogone sp. PMI_703]|nr:hypothetical protein F5884DRAFT_856721 [Xylogone sp. PMI_703]
MAGTDTAIGDAFAQSHVSYERRRNGGIRSQKKRQYICTLCGESYTRKEHCRRHELGHQGQRPYACPICGFASARKDVISRHIKVVHRQNAMRTNGAVASASALPTFQGELHVPENLGLSLRAPSNVNSTPVACSNSATLGQDSVVLGADLTLSNSNIPSTLGLGLDTGHHIQYLNSTPSNFSHVDNGRAFQMDFGFLDESVLPWPFAQSSPSYTWLDDSTRHRAGNCDEPGIAPDQGEYQTSDVFLEFSPAEIDLARVNMDLFDVDHRLSEFNFPSNYMTVRFVKGFLKLFSSHTPIVHIPTFRMGKCPAPLLLAIMACGAVYVNEYGAAVRLHHAVLKLLGENEELVVAGRRDPGFQLWDLQARLLTCQFGLFSGDSRLRRQARISFPSLQILGQEACLEAKRTPSANDATWIFKESVHRCVAWITVLRAILMCDDDDGATVRIPNIPLDAPLPCSEALWCATGISWQDLPDETPSSADCFYKLLNATPLSEDIISPFGLQSLVSAILCRVCELQLGNRSQDITLYLAEQESLERALHNWEDIWKSHPHYNSIPEAPYGPLMADSLAILNLAYYRLYGSVQLYEMKKIARSQDVPASHTLIEELYSLNAHPRLLKAISRACRCVLIRVRLGIKYILKTGSVSYPCYSPMAAYEGCLLLCWYLLGRHLAKVPPPEELSVSTMMDEIIYESEDTYPKPIQRELLPMMLYRDMIKERWVWPSTCHAISDNLDRMIMRLKPALSGKGI